jgi:glycosyltransferase 2 family protein
VTHQQQEENDEIVAPQKQLRKKKFKKILYWAKIVFAPIALGFLATLAWQSRHTILVLVNNANIWLLIVVLLVWPFLHFISPIFTVIILNEEGASITYPVALRVHIVNLPAKYVPGGIWHTVARIVDFKYQGIMSKRIALFVLLENFLAPVVTLGLGGAALWHFFGLKGWGTTGAVSLMASSLGLLLFPRIVNWRHRGASRRIGTMSYFKSLGLVVFFWIIAAGAFSTYFFAFPLAAPNPHVLEVTGAYLFSWGIGYLSFFAPQGVGVFETVAGGILHGDISLGSMVSLIAGFRILILLADILVWIGYKMYQWKSQEERIRHTVNLY